MSIELEFLGVTRTVPETPEEDWGEEVTTDLVDIMTALDTVVGRDGGDNFFIKESVSSEDLADDSTLTPTTPIVKVAGDGMAVTLNATTAIVDGSADGQKLTLIGNHAANTVTILSGANTSLNGLVTLELDEAIVLRWDVTSGKWREECRSA